MSILEKLGLAQKKKEGVPNIGDMKKRAQDEALNKKKKIFIRAIIFLGFLALLVYALPQTSFRQVASYTEGEPWRADDLTAPFTFALLKSEAEIEEERAQIRQNTPTIFHIDENASINLQNNIESVYSDLQPVLDSYVQWQRAAQDPDISASDDSLRFLEEIEQSDIELSDSSWNALLQNYATIYFQDISPQQFIGNRIRTQITSVSEELHNQGLINMSKDLIVSNEISIRDLSQRTERTISLTNVRDIEEAYEHAHFQFSQHFNDEYVEIAKDFFHKVIVPNWIFSSSDTQARLADELSDISTTIGAVAQGQVIIRRGDIVTEEKANMLRSLSEARADTASALERWIRFGGEVIVLIIASLFFLLYLFLYRKKIFENNAMFLLVFLVLSIIILSSGLIYQFDISPYIVPIAIAPLILTIIFDSRVGILSAVTLAIITAVFYDNNFEFLVATIIGCSFGVFSVRDINKRTQFFVTTPFVVLVGYILVITGFALTQLGGWESYLNQVMFISINALFILFTYPLILLFEKTFDLTTDFTLLELADTNLPILKKLMNEAPGTFHHSLQVANLAESAAVAIGANGLLCRVGALYHDIGKINKPAYFIENQSGTNEHDKLKPRMSALVIKAHVSDGVKMAEEHDLPDAIINCIKTHHGTSLIKFFYDRALKSAVDDTAEIREEDFRYDGPIPQTKETGILLLADGVEAASRSMKSPTYSKLENLITRMFDDHVHEGQLNHCPLTFHQLDIIKKTFLNILVGVYHSRVEYPEDEKEKGKIEPANIPANTGSDQPKEADLENNKDNSQASEKVEHPDRPE